MIVLIASLAGAARVHALGEEAIPAGYWLNDAAIRLHTLVPFENLDPWSRPFTRGELAAEVCRLRACGYDGGGDLARELLLQLEEELAPEIRRGPMPGGCGPRYGRAFSLRAEACLEGESRRAGALRGIGAVDFSARPFRRFAWHQRAEIDSDGESDVDFIGREWRNGVSAHMRLAYCAISFDHAHLYAGRREVDWGVGLEGGLILGGPKPPFDMVGGEIEVGSFRGEAFVAPLDDRSFVGDEGMPAVSRRYIAGHRVVFRPGPMLHVGISETVVYGGENRAFDWAYANPLTLYYGEQWNRNRDDNPFWSAEIYLKTGRSIDLYGEFLVDDFQYDRKTEPNQIACLAGARLHDVGGVPGLFLEGEYTRVNNWVYGHELPWNRYTYERANLGHPLGPDADRTLVRAAKLWGRAWEAGVSYRYERQGEGSIDDPRGSAVPFGNTFLTGDVRLVRRLAAAIDYHPRAERRFRVAGDLAEGEWTFRGSAFFRFAWNR